MNRNGPTIIVRGSVGVNPYPDRENTMQGKFQKINIMTHEHDTTPTFAEILRGLINNAECLLPYAATEYDYCEAQGYINGLKTALEVLGA
jgi:hypothetical protein